MASLKSRMEQEVKKKKDKVMSVEAQANMDVAKMEEASQRAAAAAALMKQEAIRKRTRQMIWETIEGWQGNKLGVAVAHWYGNVQDFQMATLRAKNEKDERERKQAEEVVLKLRKAEIAAEDIESEERRRAATGLLREHKRSVLAEKMLAPKLFKKLEKTHLHKAGGVIQNMMRAGYPQETIGAIIQALFFDQSEANMKPAFVIFDIGSRGEVDIDVFRKAIMLMSDDVKEDKVDKLFREADTDGSGTVDFEEFCLMIRALYPLPARNARVTKSDQATSTTILDPDISKRLHPLQKKKAGAIIKAMLTDGFKEEAVNSVCRALFFGWNLHDPAWKFAWQVFDQDGSGALDAVELKRALKLVGEGMLSENRLNEIFEEADTDGSGLIEFEEFVMLLRKMNPKPSAASLTRQGKLAQGAPKEFVVEKTLDPKTDAFRVWLHEAQLDDYFEDFKKAQLMDPESICQMSLNQLQRHMTVNNAQRNEIFTKADQWKRHKEREIDRLHLEAATQAATLKARVAVERSRENHKQFQVLHAEEYRIQHAAARAACQTVHGPRYGGYEGTQIIPSARPPQRKAWPRSQSTIPHNIPVTILSHMRTPRVAPSGIPPTTMERYIARKHSTGIYRPDNPGIPIRNVERRAGMTTFPPICRPQTKMTQALSPGWYK